MMKRNRLFLFVSIIILTMVSACTKDTSVKGNEMDMQKEQLSLELSDSDLETIEFINSNSNCDLKLMERMAVDEKEPDIPYAEESSNGAVESYGFYIEEEDAVIRTQITISKKTDENIMGIKPEDSYDNAKKILEKAGFKWISDDSFKSSMISSTFVKGKISISILTEKTEAGDINNGMIYSVGVSIIEFKV